MKFSTGARKLSTTQVVADGTLQACTMQSTTLHCCRLEHTVFGLHTAVHTVAEGFPFELVGFQGLFPGIVRFVFAQRKIPKALEHTRGGTSRAVLASKV